MKLAEKQLPISGLESGKENSEKFADIFAALKLLGIDREALFKTLEAIDSLPVQLWIHDEDHTIVYGNGCFMDTIGRCLQQPCYACLMGENEPCSCCLAKESFASGKSTRCTLCHRDTRGYDINIFHTPVTGSKGKKYIITSSYHLEENNTLGKRFAGNGKNAAREILFLVMCSVCGRLKDKNGNWLHLDAFAVEHPNVRISHGICPECTQILYPCLTEQSGQKDRTKE